MTNSNQTCSGLGQESCALCPLIASTYSLLQLLFTPLICSRVLKGYDPRTIFYLC